MSKRSAQHSSFRPNQFSAAARKPVGKIDSYSAFDKIDGRHSWQSAVPEGFVAYPVRRLKRGKVAYFNFALAREMGLIHDQHPDELTPDLTKKLIETFALQIVNEYDQRFSQVSQFELNPNFYMATRYLQLQHANKQGKTSGDGRSIWNGEYSHGGTTWDISSRGTGVTCLAPGAVEANRPLKTGAGEFGYGCGLADLSELLGSAILSEIFHLNGVHTERVLVVIDLGKGCGIGVRAAPNLIRPAHLFLYLKQQRFEPLKQATDHLIRRQIGNGRWRFPLNAPDRYQRMLREIAISFAKFAARLEREYIFAWLDWDGDNVLAEAGIIDYGSIRRFGLRHDQYRFDDVERFSTNLNEQRGKARLTVQVFAQLADYLETESRKPVENFATHPLVRLFDHEFETAIRSDFLRQVGFDDAASVRLMNSHPQKSKVEELYQSFLVLEKTKTRSGVRRVPDGTNRPAAFNMRLALRELPQLLLSEEHGHPPQPEDFIELIASDYAKKSDRKLRPPLRKKIARFLNAYLELLEAGQRISAQAPAGTESPSKKLRKNFLRAVAIRAQNRNLTPRITGNGAEFVVEEILKARKRGISQEEMQSAIDLFIASQVPPSSIEGRRMRPANLRSPAGELLRELINITQEFQEDI